MGADHHALADRLGADHGKWHDRRSGLQRKPANPATGCAERAGTGPRALGEDQDDVAALEDRLGGDDRVRVGGAAPDRERAERRQQPRDHAADEDLLLGDVVHRTTSHARDHERIEEAAVVGGDDHGSPLGDVLTPDPLHPEIDQEEDLKADPDHPVDDRVGAAFPHALMKAIVIHRNLSYPPRRPSLQWLR